MPCTLHYGIDSTVLLPLDASKLLGCFIEQAVDVADVRQATGAALAAPLDYPLLAQALVDGDQVTIAVDERVPHGGEAAQAIVDHLVEAGVEAGQITVLFRQAPSSAALVDASRRQGSSAGGHGSAARVEVHDPADRGKLGYIANTTSGRPIYLNRALGEADVVVMVGAVHGPNSWAYRGPYGGIYPAFSDRETLARFRNPALIDDREATFAKSQQEIESVGWRSGMQFTVQIVPGAGDDAAAVLAGEVQAVGRRAAALFASRHHHQIPRPAKTVIAALHGPASQTWDAVMQAVGRLLPVVEEGGAIGLCTDLAEAPGPALELLARAGDDRDDVLTYLRKERPVDLFAALQLVEAQRRVRIYLYSRLDAELVESLGISPVGEPDDLGRLAARGAPAVVVGEAQHAVVEVANS